MPFVEAGNIFVTRACSAFVLARFNFARQSAMRILASLQEHIRLQPSIAAGVPASAALSYMRAICAQSVDSRKEHSKNSLVSEPASQMYGQRQAPRPPYLQYLQSWSCLRTSKPVSPMYGRCQRRPKTPKSPVLAPIKCRPQMYLRCCRNQNCGPESQTLLRIIKIGSMINVLSKEA
ncbi:hypothetical protein K438DRAFT_1929904 [Mycena galopus ATCC 62051]|nr:hypothetical protein K438DRAFT_1929904 [Mycena galopus ATCC 62051]